MGTKVGTKIVVQLLKSWEYKNRDTGAVDGFEVVQLLKSWEYKNAFLI